MTSHILPPVSIGIPFYNAERFILDAIKSVLAQTHRDWELILVDDGSTDRSLEIAQSIDDSRVRIYSDGENRKLASRLNQIRDLATHDYIARMDADDLMSPDRIKKQLEYLESNVDKDFVSTGMCSISVDSAPKGVRLRSNDDPLDAKSVLLGTHGIIHASILARKTWLARNPYCASDSIAQDYKLWVRVFEKGDIRVGFIDEPLYFYREDGSINAAKLLKTYKSGIPFIIEKAPNLVGWKYTTYLVCRSYIKSCIVRMLDVLGGVDLLIRRRSQEVLPEVADKIQNEIDAILCTPTGSRHGAQNAAAYPPIESPPLNLNQNSEVGYQ